MTVPHWRRSEKPELIATEVCVIGGGVCGISAALHLEARGLSPVLVEAGGLGDGASSRNAGFLMRGAADNYAAATSQYGRDLTRRLWRLTEENLAMLRERGVESLDSYRPTPSCLLAYEEEERAQLVEAARLMREDGIDVRWIEPGDDGATDAIWTRGRSRPLCGLENPADASVNPSDLLSLLGEQFARTTVLEGREVFSIDREDNGIVVRTSSHEIRAGRVLACVNAWASRLLPALRSVVGANRGQMLAIERPEGVSLDRCYYANHGGEYIRQTVDGAIVVGGKRAGFAEAERTFDDAPSDEVQGAIEAWTKDVLGLEELRIAARWSGVMGFTPDRLPVVGPVGTGDRVWFCGGFTGHGMSLAHRTAQIAVGAMLDGEENPFEIDRLRSAPARWMG